MSWGDAKTADASAATVIDIGYRPHRFQDEAHKRMTRFTVLVCHRRWGKTFMAVNVLNDAALRTKKADARFCYIAPYLKQAKQIAWDYLKRFALKVPGVVANESELSVDYPSGARVRLYGSDNPDTLRGLYFDGVVMDEVADCRPQTWPEIIRPALTDRRGWALFIGTPKGLNQFHDLYTGACSGFPCGRAGERVRDPQWTAMIYRADETGLIEPAELAASRAIMSDAQYRQEWLCDFNAATDNTLITIDLAAAAAERHVTERDVSGLPRIIGVDVARFGDDRSVIFRRQGLCAFPPVVLADMDNMTLAARVAAELREWKADALFIDAGRGEGVIDRLRQLGFPVNEVNFGGRAVNPRYANKRAEMWDTMAEWLRMGGAIPNHSDLKSDLSAPTYGFDSVGRMRLESKDKIKARGLRSPDTADALALTFAAPVAVRQKEMGRALAPAMAEHDYDPLAVFSVDLL